VQTANPDFEAKLCGCAGR